MKISFQPITFLESFEIFCKIRRLANIEVIGKENLDIAKLPPYLETKLALFGEMAFLHIYLDEELIGQMELGCKLEQGYVNLFYLLPRYRSKGYFKIMHQKMLEIIRLKGFKQLKTLTPPNNQQAINIYQHYGWVRYGFDAEKPEMLCFMLVI